MATNDFNIRVVEDELNKAIDEIENKVFLGLCKIGEEAIILMRDTNQKSGKDYMDRTGNLRSSCGFAVAKDGQILKVGGFLGNQEGQDKGENLAKRIAISESTNKFCLVLVAGMEYASYVQAMGYDVMETAEVNAINRAKELTETITSKYGN